MLSNWSICFARSHIPLPPWDYLLEISSCELYQIKNFGESITVNKNHKENLRQTFHACPILRSTAENKSILSNLDHLKGMSRGNR